MMAHAQLNQRYKCHAAVQRVMQESSTIVAYHLQCPAVLITWPESICTRPVPPATKHDFLLQLCLNLQPLCAFNIIK
jgi:hypothetical protein